MKKYIYKGENFTLYVGNNIDIIPKLNFKNSVIITSPPYNFNRKYDKYKDNLNYENYLQFLYKTFYTLYKYIEGDTRVIVILKDDFVNFRFTSYHFYNIMTKIGYKMYNYFIVESSHISKFTAWGSWCSASAPRVRANFEIIQVYFKKNYKRRNKGTSTITSEEFKEYTLALIKGNDWFIAEINKKEHPAQFSPVLIDRLIKLYSYKEDTIIDIFCGIANAGISALRNNRKFIGIDISEEYIKIAYKKLKQIENLLFKK